MTLLSHFCRSKRHVLFAVTHKKRSISRAHPTNRFDCLHSHFLLIIFLIEPKVSQYEIHLKKGVVAELAVADKVRLNKQ